MMPSTSDLIEKLLQQFPILSSYFPFHNVDDSHERSRTDAVLNILVKDCVNRALLDGHADIIDDVILFLLQDGACASQALELALALFDTSNHNQRDSDKQMLIVCATMVKYT